LLYRLHKLWAGSAYAQARPRTYVFLGRANTVQARVLSSWGIVPLFSEGDDIGGGLQQLLERLAEGVRRAEPAPDAAPAPAAALTPARKRARRKPR
jgi:hypothetical protein